MFDSKGQHGALQHLNLSFDFLVISFLVPVLLVRVYSSDSE